MGAWGAQMELLANQRRNRSATEMRAKGRPKGNPSYWFQYVRTVTGVTPDSEVARLSRAGEL